MNNFYAGAGVAPIIFPESYFPTHENFIGEHDLCHSRTIILKDPGLTLVMVSVELPSIKPAEVKEPLYELVGKLTGADREHIWISTTHNLGGMHVPVVTPGQSGEVVRAKIAQHMEAVSGSVEASVKAALADLRPAEAGFGYGSSDTICNRDIKTNQGWWVGLNPSGPSDKTMAAVRFADENDRTIAVIYSYPLKSSVMEGVYERNGYRRSSSDLSGQGSSYAEEKLGGVVMFYMSTAGDQVPARKGDFWAADDNGDIIEVSYRDKSWEFLDSLGKQLGQDIVDTVSGISQYEADPVFSLREVSFRVPGQKVFPKKERPVPTLSYDFPAAEDQTYVVRGLRIGGNIIVAMNPEITCPIGMEMRKNSPFRVTMLCTMVNGGHGYIGTDADFERLEYPALFQHAARGTDRVFIETVKNLCEEMYGEKKADTD